MTSTTWRRAPSARGFTLIELLIVLSVLAAVSGMAISLMSGVEQQTHGATGAATIKSLDQAFTARRAQGKKAGAPELDSLIDDGATPGVITYTGYGAPVAMGGKANLGLTAVDLASFTTGRSGGMPMGVSAARIGQALAMAGITSTMQMRNDLTGGDATFANTTGTTFAIDGTPQGRVVELDPTTVVTSLALDPAKYYVLFGLGQESDLVGVDLDAAPVFRPMGKSTSETYSNYLLIYEVPPMMGAARYVGSAMPMTSGLHGLDHHIEVYYKAASK